MQFGTNGVSLANALKHVELVNEQEAGLVEMVNLGMAIAKVLCLITW